MQSLAVATVGQEKGLWRSVSTLPAEWRQKAQAFQFFRHVLIQEPGKDSLLSLVQESFQAIGLLIVWEWVLFVKVPDFLGHVSRKNLRFIAPEQLGNPVFYWETLAAVSTKKSTGLKGEATLAMRASEQVQVR